MDSTNAASDAAASLCEAETTSACLFWQVAHEQNWLVLCTTWTLLRCTVPNHNTAERIRKELKIEYHNVKSSHMLRRLKMMTSGPQTLQK